MVHFLQMAAQTGNFFSDMLNKEIYFCATSIPAGARSLTLLALEGHAV